MLAGLHFIYYIDLRHNSLLWAVCQGFVRHNSAKVYIDGLKGLSTAQNLFFFFQLW